VWQGTDYCGSPIFSLSYSYSIFCAIYWVWAVWEEVEDLAQEYDLSVAGDGLSMLQRLDALNEVVPYIQVQEQ